MTTTTCPSCTQWREMVEELANQFAYRTTIHGRPALITGEMAGLLRAWCQGAGRTRTTPASNREAA
jgi:hypothetical protein